MLVLPARYGKSLIAAPGSFRHAVGLHLLLQGATEIMETRVGQNKDGGSDRASLITDEPPALTGSRLMRTGLG